VTPPPPPPPPKKPNPPPPPKKKTHTSRILAPEKLDHNLKDKKKRKNKGKYSFVNRSRQNLKQLTADRLGFSPVNLKV